MARWLIGSFLTVVVLTLLALGGVERIAGLGLIAIGVCTLLIWLISERLLTARLQSLSDASIAIASGDFGARVWPRPTGAIGALSDAFNRMATTVQAQVVGASQERVRLAAALNSSLDAVVALDAELRVLFANLAAERLFQRPAAVIAGNPFVWTLADDHIVEAVRASRDQGESLSNVIERPGRQFLQVVTTPIRGGGDWRVLVVVHDLTDAKRIEQVRRDFVANVSHELRTPLAGLKAVVETLADGAIDDPQVSRDFLARAEDEVDRLVQMVQELLELSRIETGELPLELVPVDVAALLEESVERLRPQAARKHIRLDVTVATDVGAVVMDAGRIEHVIINLVHNAIKFTPDGGSVQVEAERRDGSLLVSVRDNGAGIPARDLPRVFERFYKADHSRAGVGSGLGLAVVKHAVEAHGGSVHAESDEGVGSRFSFTLPLRPIPAVETTAKLSSEP